MKISEISDISCHESREFWEIREMRTLTLLSGSPGILSNELTRSEVGLEISEILSTQCNYVPAVMHVRNGEICEIW